MSGIVGIYHLNGQLVEPQRLTRMVDVLAHRGSDGADIWHSESVGLGHRMLWTTPESLLEKLPLINQTGDTVITADIRIDNRDELISALQYNTCPPEKITDSQLVLAAYDKWGEECPEHLLGDFAFAIWDGRKQILFCARDHFGVKPIYYYHQPGKNFVFASEIKAILCLPEVPRSLNQVRIADYLHPFTEDKSITSYQDVFRLPPGHSMTISHTGELRLNSYWCLKVGDELRLNSDEEYAQAFREIFTEAVRCRLRSAFPVSSHLSGGLDSSSVTCVARDLLQEQGSQLHTFSNIFDDVPECDERPFINTVLQQGNLIPHYVRGDEFGPLSEWKQVFQYEDEAIIGASHFLVWGLNRATKQAGIRISLNGFDGDTVISHGAQYFSELARQGKWATFITEATAVSQHFNTSLSALFYQHGVTYLEELAQQKKWIAFGKTVNEIHKHFQISRRKLLLSYGLKPLVPQSLLKLWRSLHGYNKSQSYISPIISSGFAQQVGLNLSKTDKKNQNLSLTVREEQWRDLTSSLFAHTLGLLDYSSAAFSIESRHPFMDKRLVEFCLSLPPEQKLRQGWSRFILRKSLNGILPKEVQWRGGKTSMSPNFLRGFLHLDGKLLEELVINDPSNIQEIVNLDSLRKSYHSLVSEGKNTDDDIQTVWKSVTLALWLRHAGIKP